MQRFLKRYQLWLLYTLFLIAAIRYGSSEGWFATDSDYALGKHLVLLVFVCFLVFSLYATHRENFFRSLGEINKFFWGRQICTDLYISVFLSLALIYLVEGSLTTVLLWAIPVLFFANLAILPYIILNYGEIVRHFLP